MSALFSYMYIYVHLTALKVLFCEMHTCFVLHGIQPAWSVDLIGVLVAGVSSSCVPWAPWRGLLFHCWSSAPLNEQRRCLVYAEISTSTPLNVEQLHPFQFEQVIQHFVWDIPLCRYKETAISLTKVVPPDPKYFLHRVKLYLNKSPSLSWSCVLKRMRS